MTPDELAYVAEMTRRLAGVIIRADKSFFVEARLGPIARRKLLDSVSDLIHRVRGSGDARLERQIVAATLVQDTCFFRDHTTFDYLERTVLPELADRTDAPLRILSAGCATGQEAYSLAIAALDCVSPTGLEIVAIDFSAQALLKAELGIYSHFEVQRGLPIRKLLRYFEQIGDHWQARPELRERVHWQERNLLDSLEDLGEFDVILCSHVLSNFDPFAAAATLDRLEAVCRTDGLMVFGAGETVSPPAAFARDVLPTIWRRNPILPRASAID